MSDIEPDEVFEKLETARDTNRLGATVTTADPTCESSKSKPGMVVQVWRDGTRIVGSFESGEFVPALTENNTK